MILIRLLLLFILFSNAHAQESKKFWRENEKLVWSDFKCKPDVSHPFSATTATGLSYKFSADIYGNHVKVNYEIQSYFVPNESWVKKDSNTDRRLLAHEQLHFDITELYARKFRKKMATFKFTKNLEAEIESIYEPIAKARIADQQLYDAETHHSKNRMEQRKWELKIAAELIKLKEFASK